jgi:hypothetical protein
MVFKHGVNAKFEDIERSKTGYMYIITVLWTLRAFGDMSSIVKLFGDKKPPRDSLHHIQLIHGSIPLLFIRDGRNGRILKHEEYYQRWLLRYISFNTRSLTKEKEFELITR